MRRVLLVLWLAVTVVVGVVPSATGLAANTTFRSALTSYPLRAGLLPVNEGSYGWTMVKPIIPVTTTMVVPHNNVTGTAVAQLALRYVGYRYTLVGNSPALGFSCIGLVSYVYQTLGIPLPDELGNARAFAPPVAFNNLQPGDILWFGNTVWPGLSHVAIYLGGGRFVHAAWFNRGVITSSLRNDPVDGNYWIEHYLGASRPWGGAGVGSFGIPTTVRMVPGVPAVTVIVPRLNLRRWWSLRAPIRQVLPGATPLNIMRRTGHWLQVMTPDGMKGWVASAKLARTPGPRSARHATHHRLLNRQVARRHAARVAKSRWLRIYGSQSHARRTSHARRASHIQVRHGSAHRVHALRRTHGQTKHAVQWPRQWFGVQHHRQLVLLVVHVRAAPSLHARILRLIMPKTHIHVVARGGAWKRVRLPSGHIGYIYAKYLR